MAGIGQVVIQPLQPAVPVVEGTEGWERLVQSTNVDLSGPLSLCTIALSMLPMAGPNVHDVLVLQTDSATLMALCQESLSAVISATFQRQHSLALSGQYDCETAGSMVTVADLIGEDTNNQSAWPLGRRELVYLLTASKRIQQLVLEVRPNKTGAFALEPGHFAPAMPPVGCGGPIGTNGTSGGTAVVSYGDQPGAGSGSPTHTGSLWPAVAVGLAVSLLAFVAYTGSTQRRG